LQIKTLDNLEADVFFDGNEMQLKATTRNSTLPEKQQLVLK
jgi:RNA polymerase sigma-70 factor (ECF subfamily)